MCNTPVLGGIKLIICALFGRCEMCRRVGSHRNWITVGAIPVYMYSLMLLLLSEYFLLALTHIGTDIASCYTARSEQGFPICICLTPIRTSTWLEQHESSTVSCGRVMETPVRRREAKDQQTKQNDNKPCNRTNTNKYETNQRGCCWSM